MKMKNKTVRKKAAPKYKEFHCELPYSYGLLYRHGLIPERTDSLTVISVTLRLIRIPVIAKGRRAGLPVEYILEHLSLRTLQRIRAKLRRASK